DWKPTSTFTVSSVVQGTTTGSICGSLQQNAGSGFTSAVYLMKNVSNADAPSIVWTLSGSPGTSNGDMQIVEIDGASTTAPCDSTGSSANTAASGTGWTAGSAAATQTT